MTQILSIETSTSVCSAALHQDGKLIALSEIHEDQSHASRLAVLIHGLFQLSGISFSDLTAIAVSSGPGSYTGLRIGVSTAKGLCFANNLPLIAIDALEIMTWRILKQGGGHGLFCPMLDARRMEAYCCIFNGALERVQPIEARILESGSFADLLAKDRVTFFGNAVDKINGVITHENAVFLHQVYPSASDLGELAFRRYESRRFEDVIHFEPIYLKEFLVKKSTKLDGVLNK